MPSVLVVDDSAFDRELIDRILKEDPTLNVESVENGRAALDRLNGALIDIVVTDLQMPDMDGLELVTHVRVAHPNIPVVLATGHGSEEIALHALERGAASYVPKPILKDKLLETVQEVLALAQVETAAQELVACFTDLHFKLSLENKLELHEPLIEFVQQMIVGIKLCDATGGIQVGVALTAALSNALFRGNLEITHEDEEAEKKQADQGIHTSLYGQRRIQLPYRDRKTYVEISINHDEARFTIRDEGSGFDLSEKPDPQDANELETRPGRGLLLMHTLMDEVAFNDTGTEVTLVKKRQN